MLISRVPYPEVTKDSYEYCFKWFLQQQRTTLCVEVKNGIIYEQASSNSDLEEANISKNFSILFQIWFNLSLCIIQLHNVFTLLLHNMRNFFSFGMEELCIKFGTGTITPICTFSYTQ